MADDKSKRGSPDTKRINLKEDYELEYWKKTLNVSGQQLAGAVRAVGTSAAKVRAYLEQKKIR